MKPVLNILLGTALSAMTLLSCSSDQSTTPDATGDGSVRMTMNDLEWKSTSTLGSEMTSFGHIRITVDGGSSAAKHVVELLVLEPEVGAHSIEDGFAGITVVEKVGNPPNQIEMFEGVITVNHIDTVMVNGKMTGTVSGTFSAEAGSYSMKNGMFNVKYVQP